MGSDRGCVWIAHLRNLLGSRETDRSLMVEDRSWMWPLADIDASLAPAGGADYEAVVAGMHTPRVQPKEATEPGEREPVDWSLLDEPSATADDAEVDKGEKIVDKVEKTVDKGEKTVAEDDETVQKNNKAVAEDDETVGQADRTEKSDAPPRDSGALNKQQPLDGSDPMAALRDAGADTAVPVLEEPPLEEELVDDDGWPER